MKCITDRLCLEDETRYDEAISLVEAGLANLNMKLTPLDYSPKFIFCSSQSCFKRLGFDRAAAQTVGGTLATIIGPCGWTDYYVKHELIHQWQADTIGQIRLMLLPEWLREGMAYSLSDDPRTLLKVPWQGYREDFEIWYGDVKREDADIISALKAVK